MKKKCITFISLGIALLFSSCVRISNLSLKVWEQGQEGKGVYLLPQENGDSPTAFRTVRLYEAGGKLYAEGVRTVVTSHTTYSNKTFNHNTQYKLKPNSKVETVYCEVLRVSPIPGICETGYVQEVNYGEWISELPKDAKRIPNDAVWGNCQFLITMPNGALTTLANEPELQSNSHALYATPLAILTGIAIDIPISIIGTTCATAYHTLIIPIKAVSNMPGME